METKLGSQFSFQQAYCRKEHLARWHHQARNGCEEEDRTNVLAYCAWSIPDRVFQAVPSHMFSYPGQNAKTDFHRQSESNTNTRTENQSQPDKRQRLDDRGE